MLKGSPEFKRMMDNTADDEDVFPLVGRDIHAAGTVRDWIRRVVYAVGTPTTKTAEAEACAARMASRTDRKVPD